MYAVAIQLSLLGIKADTWQAIEAIAVSVGAGIAVLGILGLAVAVHQLREERSTHQLHGLVTIMEQFTTMASPEVRQWLDEQDGERLARSRSGDRARALGIVYAYNRLELLIELRFVPAKPLLMLWGDGRTLSHWATLQPLIKKARTEPGYERLGIYFQRFCERISAWMDSDIYKTEVQDALNVLIKSERRPP